METTEEVRLFVCGDVMMGRGIDQILPHPGRPVLHEPWVKSALDYVALAERRCGPISRPVAPEYVWGDALGMLDRLRPHVRLINLETAVTTSDEAWPGKGIHYRMHPANLPALAALAPDCCVLANNHVLDWGRRGLRETLRVLHAAGLATAGAGLNRTEAQAPACIDLASGGGGSGRVLVFGLAVESSGVPAEWAATGMRAGVTWLPDVSAARASAFLEGVAACRRPGDLVVASIHWGPNWGHALPPEERAFARMLVDGGVDLVHGHSSHHPKGIEVYRERLILYGCGDFLNDYEGISGYEWLRPDLVLMYFLTLEAGTGRLLRLVLAPMRIARLRVNRADEEGAAWLQVALNREGRILGTRLEREEGLLRVSWD